MKPQLIQKASPEYWFSVIIYALEQLGKATYIDIYSFLTEDYNLEDDFFTKLTGKSSNKFAKIIQWVMGCLIKNGDVVKLSRSVFTLKLKTPNHYSYAEAKEIYFRIRRKSKNNH